MILLDSMMTQMMHDSDMAVLFFSHICGGIPGMVGALYIVNPLLQDTFSIRTFLQLGSSGSVGQDEIFFSRFWPIRVACPYAHTFKHQNKDILDFAKMFRFRTPHDGSAI